MIACEEEDLPRFSPRFYNIATRRLGYTHTEAGFRRLGQLMDELNDLVDMEREAAEVGRPGGDDDFWYLTNERGEE